MGKQLLIFVLIFCCILRAAAQSGFINTIAGVAGSNGFNGDGTAATAELNFPAGMCIDKGGNILFCDEQNYRVRKLTPSGMIVTIAGNGTYGFSGDGGQATDAQLYDPGSLCVDAIGNIYIADIANNAVRKVDVSGVISTIAGIGGVDSNGYNGDGITATAAKLSAPFDVAIDPAGEIYIADAGNNRIRKINSAGIISTVAGNSARGFSSDGGMATNASLVFPFSVVLDPVGNLYITDSSRIRKINAAGIISTVAGNGTLGNSGDGGPATAALLNSPIALALDAAGNIYVADQNTNSVRKIDASGMINLIAGNGVFGYSGDGGPATAASFRFPWGMAVDTAGNLYVSDNENFVLREIMSGDLSLSVIKQATVNNGRLTIFPNPASAGVTIEIPQQATIGGTLDMYNASGRLVNSTILCSKVAEVSLADLCEGVYFLTYSTSSGRWDSQLIRLH